MILQKVRVGEPAILMGETGCGKTYLIKYIVNVLYKDFGEYCEFIFHYGVEEKTFIRFMKQLIDRALNELKDPEGETEETKESQRKDSKSKVFWVFFDEFNTSHLQGYVNEIMNDRVFSLADESKCRNYKRPISIQLLSKLIYLC